VVKTAGASGTLTLKKALEVRSDSLSIGDESSRLPAAFDPADQHMVWLRLFGGPERLLT
jgi:hypothetical protein